MPRLVEGSARAPPQGPIRLAVGDILLIRASGGRLPLGAEAVLTLLGIFRSAVTGPNGAVVEPAGPPDSLLVAASAAGTGSIEAMTGDPFHAPRRIRIAVRVG